MMMDETRSDLPDSLTAQAASNSEPRLKTSSELRAAELRLEDLDIRVHTPLKHGDGLLDSHVVYTVTTKTTRQQFDGSNFDVHRRYSDFVVGEATFCCYVTFAIMFVS
eukprot:TRINITY_DN8030_c0_g1_i1.p3 TRINITY_DN8030_c0_g1~~TRINITY_DN8030_c0_g1_i1.p3  ORF type:complete len:108 (+),score=11.14 TRINITY_DN8030_c0_g1_i1:82-405(+)